MPTTTRSARLVPSLGGLLAAALLAVGCTSTVPGSPGPPALSSTAQNTAAASPAAPAGDAVTWVDGVCGAVLQLADSMTRPPNLTGSNPSTVVHGLGDYVGTASAAVQRSLDTLGRVGPSPVEGGDAFVRDLDHTLTAVKSSLDGVATQLDSVDPNDPNAVAAALPNALAPLQRLAENSDPAAGLQSNPQLERAAAQAPNCQRIRASSGR